MQRWIVLLLALLLAITSLLFFMANRQIAAVDLYVSEFSLPIGLLIPLTLFTGFVIAGLILIVAVVIPLRLRLRAQTKALEALQQHRGSA